LPAGVRLVAAVKTKTPEQIQEAIKAGLEIIGQNYVQEAQLAYNVIGAKVKWHFIGHLQKNKVKKAIKIFDLIETVDSIELASEIDKQCAKEKKTMPVLIEINSGAEEQKFGASPVDAQALIEQLSKLHSLKVMGLMTMGPVFCNPEDARKYFTETKKLFDKLKSLAIPNTQMKYLSMGMSNSYKIAIEEGANIVRIGSKIFGERNYTKQ